MVLVKVGVGDLNMLEEIVRGLQKGLEVVVSLVRDRKAVLRDMMLRENT